MTSGVAHAVTGAGTEGCRSTGVPGSDKQVRKDPLEPTANIKGLSDRYVTTRASLENEDKHPAQDQTTNNYYRP